MRSTNRWPSRNRRIADKNLENVTCYEKTENEEQIDLVESASKNGDILNDGTPSELQKKSDHVTNFKIQTYNF